MSDVADILGGARRGALSPPKPTPLPATHQPSRAMKLLGMPRDVVDILSGKPKSLASSNNDNSSSSCNITNPLADAGDPTVTAELPMSVPVIRQARPLVTSSSTRSPADPEVLLPTEAAVTETTTLLAPSPSRMVKVGAKWISSAQPARPWKWAPFTSSSRTDGLLLHHWVRAQVEYPDYPYARFDIHLDPVVYTEEEYRAYLDASSSSSPSPPISTRRTSDPSDASPEHTNHSSSHSSTSKDHKTKSKNQLSSPDEKGHHRATNTTESHHDDEADDPEETLPKAWTKSETDFLMELARKFELRWPVIYDRWLEAFPPEPPPPTGPGRRRRARSESRRLEDLQHRFYTVAALLAQSRISQEAAVEAQNLTNAAVAAVAAAASANPSPPHLRRVPTTEGASAERPAPIAPGDATHVPPPPSSLPPLSQTPPSPSGHTELILEGAAARALASADKQNQPLIANIGTGTSNKMFDWEYERERRTQLEALWNRSKEEEAEELQLREELKQVEAQLRKIKKAGAHILAAAHSKGGGSMTGSGGNGGGAVVGVVSATSSANPSRAVSPVPGPSESNHAALLDQAFLSTAPTPMPQFPYLQSGRLALPATGGPAGLNKTLLTRMETVLDEMRVPKRPLPTKRVCDLYDSVRKDVLTLLILQKNTLQKEGLLESKRLKLAKLGGASRVVDEETIMGIAPIVATAGPSTSTTPAPAAGIPAPLVAGSATGSAPAQKKRPKAKTPTSGNAAGGGTTSSNKPKTSAKAPAAANKSEETASGSGNTTKNEWKEAPDGGKQARKTGTKRKKKQQEAKSPIHTTGSGTLPPSGTSHTLATATTTPLAAAAAGSAETETAVSAAVNKSAVDSTANEGKGSAKKRARKNP